MQVEIAKKYVQNDDYFYLELNIRYDEEDDQRIQNLISRHFNDMVDPLRRDFKVQGELYKAIDEEKYMQDKYNPNEEYFYHGDTGFREFTKDLTERELRKLTEIFTDMILEKAEYTQQQFREQHTSRVSTTLNPETETVTLERIDVREPAYIMSNDKCYAIKMEEITDKPSMKEITEDVYNKIYEDMKNQMTTQKTSYERKIERIKAKLEAQKNELFVETLKDASGILADWEFTNYEGHLYLKYKQEIKVDRVVYNGATYEYGDQFKKMYVQGLKVRVTPNIRNGDVKVTRGYNLHFRGSGGCIGALEGKPLFDILRELPKSLEIANMDSPLNDEVQSDISRNFLSRQEREAQNPEEEQTIRRIDDWRI